MTSKYLRYEHEAIYPEKSDVYKAMEIPEKAEIPIEVEDLYHQSFELFKELIAPKGIYQIITKTDFQQIYDGQNQNEKLSPLPEIYPKANLLALYVFTLGKKISDHINQLIKEKDYPLGFMLDRIASESADKASGVAEKIFTERVLMNDSSSSNIKTLLYSPGYCGWHICAQKKIFKYLKPEQIGISLNESYLMTPIKSVSGVLVAGKQDIHEFKNNFGFCRDCTTFSCRKRMR